MSMITKKCEICFETIIVRSDKPVWHPATIFAFGGALNEHRRFCHARERVLNEAGKFFLGKTEDSCS